ncbi:copper amine oxidase N-terminal domain-containing protein [Paenibacillus sp. PSB04]|uniref:copper amine oxidase N-terminal domain-containing protein n=1 Tax=Paenibacillus sp. PSB04 TaxID=2866810 RepID=UPI0021F1CEDC|nr:copper amine oxidase N-terminal domain-containing protein [Paenibacillus sp. PSB04]UYO02459.1 copper amine oxidase N-terminal domain-containing protein [Paenibacillus sp. PSB04]
MKMRSILTAVLCSLGLIALDVPATAAPFPDSVQVGYPDGSEATLSNGDYTIDNGNILVNPTYVTGALPFIVPGKGIWWDNTKKTLIFAFTDSDDYIKERIKIKIGEKEFKDKGKIFELRQEAILKNGRVYLPIRGIAEAYGKKVHYTKSNGIINILIQK